MNKDKEILDEMTQFIRDKGPIVKCIVITDKATMTLEVLTDYNSNTKLTRRTK